MGCNALARRIVVVLLVGVAMHLAPRARAQIAGATTPVLIDHSASELFGSVKTEVEIGWIISEERWQRSRASEGFRRANEYWWIKTDSSGEIRVRAVFTKDRTMFTLIFVPAHATPIPEALLVHLLGMAEHVSLNGGDTIALRLPAQTGPGCLDASAMEVLTVRLTGGLLVNTEASVQCNTR